MILPTKHIPPNESLLGVGATLLRHLNKDRTVTDLWERVRVVKQVGSFGRFVMALDLLYVVGGVHLERGMLRRTRRRADEGPRLESATPTVR